MIRFKYVTNNLLNLGMFFVLFGCTNEIEHPEMLSDKEFHSRIIQLQNKFNASLRIDENSLEKNDETLTVINDIMRTIENSCFEYELITSEEGGLIAMPILSTTATRSNSAEVSLPTYEEEIVHSLLPCRLKINCKGTHLTMKSQSALFSVVNISCNGSYTIVDGFERFRVEGHFKIAVKGLSDYTGYYIYRLVEGDSNELEIHEVPLY